MKSILVEIRRIAGKLLEAIALMLCGLIMLCFLALYMTAITFGLDCFRGSCFAGRNWVLVNWSVALVVSACLWWARGFDHMANSMLAGFFIAWLLYAGLLDDDKRKSLDQDLFSS